MNILERRETTEKVKDMKRVPQTQVKTITGFETVMMLDSGRDRNIDGDEDRDEAENKVKDKVEDNDEDEEIQIPCQPKPLHAKFF